MFYIITAYYLAFNFPQEDLMGRLFLLREIKEPSFIQLRRIKNWHNLWNCLFLRMVYCFKSSSSRQAMLFVEAINHSKKTYSWHKGQYIMKYRKILTYLISTPFCLPNYAGASICDILSCFTPFFARILSLPHPKAMWLAIFTL